MKWEPPKGRSAGRPHQAVAARVEPSRGRAHEWAGGPEGDRPVQLAALQCSSDPRRGPTKRGGGACLLSQWPGPGCPLPHTPGRARHSGFGLPPGEVGDGEPASLPVRRPGESLSLAGSQRRGGQCLRGVGGQNPAGARTRQQRYPRLIPPSLGSCFGHP